MPTRIGDELVTPWGERRVVVEVEDACNYVERRVAGHGSSAGAVSRYGTPDYGERRQRGFDERKRERWRRKAKRDQQQ